MAITKNNVHLVVQDEELEGSTVTGFLGATDLGFVRSL